ncbi:MAG: RNA binding S1 domain protein [Parcubacteria group bacterium GW2011_GWB1_40_14]|nr:MAG: RNA binding S1 domain protein [Parcubacteria group bacterium GW2011_GWB1_40_14]
MDLLNKLASALNPSDQNEDEDSEGENAEAKEKPETTAKSKETRTTADALKAILNSQAPPLKTGDMVNGKVIGRGVATVFIDLGAQGTGIIFGREFYKAQDIIRGINKEDVISAKVVEPENDEGYVELSVKDAGREMVWQKLEEYKTSGITLKVKITAANRGGLVAQVEGTQAFLPVSQLSAAHYPRVEGGDKDKIYGELQKFVGQEFEIQVLDFAPQEQKLILSEKAVERSELSELLKDYKVGDTIGGTVSGVVDFGIFVRFGPEDRLEGLAHISELDWQMVQSPNSLFSVGDEIKAKIIDMGDGRVSLSIKALKPDPWQDITEKFPKGAQVQGKVVKFSPFGAFVEISSNVQALIHISEFGNEAKMKEKLSLDKKYSFRIASIDQKEHRMSLKMADESAEEESKEVPEEKAVTETKTEISEEKSSEESKPAEE